MRSIQAIVSDLSKPIALRHIKTRKQGGSDISYIEWHTAAQYLDYFAPGWSSRILSVSQVGNLVTIHGRLSIPSADGIVERDATGIEEIDAKGYGDEVSNAAAMAFKRAGASLDLGDTSTTEPHHARPCSHGRCAGFSYTTGQATP